MLRSCQDFLSVSYVDIKYQSPGYEFRPALQLRETPSDSLFLSQQPLLVIVIRMKWEWHMGTKRTLRSRQPAANTQVFRVSHSENTGLIPIIVSTMLLVLTPTILTLLSRDAVIRRRTYLSDC
jgi:hypothetical protein